MSAFIGEDRATHTAGGDSARWIEVATLRELNRRRGKQVTVDGEEIALFHVDGEVYALQDVCIHKGRQLSKGTVMRGRVVCPGHQWQFDLATGWVSSQERCQPTYAVRVEDEKVYVNPERRIRAEPPGDAGDVE